MYALEHCAICFSANSPHHVLCNSLQANTQHNNTCSCCFVASIPLHEGTTAAYICRADRMGGRLPGQCRIPGDGTRVRSASRAASSSSSKQHSPFGTCNRCPQSFPLSFASGNRCASLALWASFIAIETACGSTTLHVATADGVCKCSQSCTDVQAPNGYAKHARLHQPVSTQ